MKYWMIGLLVAMVSACANKLPDPQKSSAPYQYSFVKSETDASCTTETRSFFRLTEMCKALTDDQANHHCTEQAHDKFMINCPAADKSTSGAATPSANAPADPALDVGVYPKFHSDSIADVSFIGQFATDLGYCRVSASGAYVGTKSAKLCAEDIPSLTLEIHVMGGAWTVLQVVKPLKGPDVLTASGHFISATLDGDRSLKPQRIQSKRISDLNGGWEKLSSSAKTDLRVDVSEGDLMHDAQIKANIYLDGKLALRDLLLSRK